jgi:uncharacterized membrane protein
MKPFDQIDTLEGVRALDAPVRGLNALSRVVSAPRRLRSVLAGEPFGHSAHPMLVQVPIGAWVSAGWLDCLPRTENAAAVLTGIGIAGAVPAIAAGLVDYADLDRLQRRVAFVHVAANVLSLACQVLSLRERLTGRLRRGQWIGLVGTASLAAGGLLGGHLAHPLTTTPR